MKINEIEILNSKVEENEITSVLLKHGLIKEVIREILIDRLIKKEMAKFDEKGIKNVLLQFCKKNNITDDNQFNNFLLDNGLDRKQLEDSLMKPIAIQNYKKERWESEVISYYYDNKEQFDVLTFKMIVLSNSNLAQELHFRLKEKENTWEQICESLNIDIKSVTFGPIKREEIDKVIQEKLSQLKIGCVSKPFTINNAVAICELLERDDGKPSEKVKEDIINKKFNDFVENEIQKTLKKLAIKSK